MSSELTQALSDVAALTALGRRVKAAEAAARRRAMDLMLTAQQDTGADRFAAHLADGQTFAKVALTGGGQTTVAEITAEDAFAKWAAVEKPSLVVPRVEQAAFRTDVCREVLETGEMVPGVEISTRTSAPRLRVDVERTMSDDPRLTEAGTAAAARILEEK